MTLNAEPCDRTCGKIALQGSTHLYIELQLAQRMRAVRLITPTDEASPAVINPGFSVGLELPYRGRRESESLHKKLLVEKQRWLR